MKKLICLLLCLGLWIPLCGFTSVTSEARMFSGGAVQEIVSVSYDKSDAQKLGINLAALNLEMQEIRTDIKKDLSAQLFAKISDDENLSKDDFLVEGIVDSGQENGTLKIAITYYNPDVYNKARADFLAKATSTLETSVFLKQYITTAPIALSTFEHKGTTKNLMEYVYDSTVLGLQTMHINVSNILTANRTFTYKTSTVRLHADADATAFDPETNMTAFTWRFDAGEDLTITLWQTRPNAEVWYVLALGLTGLFALGVWLAARAKKKTPLDAE